MHRERPIVYYVSAHGYGHGVRTCDILNALHGLYLDVPVVLVTELPVRFLKNRLRSRTVAIRQAGFDVGMVQLDSVRVDIPGTLVRAQALCARRGELIQQEKDFLKRRDAAMVVSDIPAIPLEAARAMGLPALAVGNFAWDWIYSEFAGQDGGWNEVIAQFAEGYAQSDLLLRLPFAEKMKAFPHKEDMPIVATPGTPRRDEIAQLTGCPKRKKWALLSFTSLDLSEAALDRIEAIDDHEFFTVKPLEWNRRNTHAIDRERVCYSDVLASVDVVVSKPGFGLVSECIVNRKPLIYVDRTEFLEYPILVRGIEHFLRNLHLPQARLYEGDLEDALSGIWDRPEPAPTMPAGGGRLAAKRIMDFYPG